jgi:hypothetical protein
MSRWSRGLATASDPSRLIRKEEQLVLSTVAPSAAQQRLARVIVVTLALALYLAAWPFRPSARDAATPSSPHACHGDVRD